MGQSAHRHHARAASPMRTISAWTGRRCRSCSQKIGVELIAALAMPFLLLMLAALGGNMIQHRLVWSFEALAPKLSKISPARRLQAAVLARRRSPISPRAWSSWCWSARVLTALMWPERGRIMALERTDLGDGAAARPDAGAQADGRGGRHDGGGGDGRLPVPIPAMVRAAENVAARNEGGVQAERRRPDHQGQDEAGAPSRACASA